MVGRGDHNHNNRFYTIKITKTGCIITRNKKHIKTTPITSEQFLRDQLTQHAEDPLDKILKQYESLSPHNVQNNDKDTRREETGVNNHNDTWISIAQGHTINNTPNNHEHTSITEKAPRNGHIDKADENINIWTCCGRISRKPDRFTYH